MISEALELRAEGGRISHSVCVFILGCCGLGEGRGWMVCMPGYWSNVGTLLECEVKTLMTPDHTAFHVRSSEYVHTAVVVVFFLNERAMSSPEK